MPASPAVIVMMGNGTASERVLNNQFYSFRNNRAVFHEKAVPAVRLLNAQEKWSMPFRSRNLTLSQWCIYFEGRLNHVITL